jgi:hypothetical protein
MATVSKKIETQEEAWDFAEFGIFYEHGKMYRVEAPFFLKVNDGPLRSMPIGARVFLDAGSTGPDLFYANKVVPVELGDTFTVIQPFRMVGKDGEYVYLERGDVIKLGRDEAIPLLRELKIKEKPEGRSE